jgi:hypothetical protein
MNVSLKMFNYLTEIIIIIIGLKKILRFFIWNYLNEIYNSIYIACLE